MFAPVITLKGQVSTRPPKDIPVMRTRILRHYAWGFGAPCDLCAWRRKSVKKVLKTPSRVNFTPSPRRPRRVENLKLYPLPQILEIINPINFQLNSPMMLAPLGVEVGGLQLSFETTHNNSCMSLLQYLVGFCCRPAAVSDVTSSEFMRPIPR